MIVYIVITTWYDSFELIGAYNTRESAQAVIDLHQPTTDWHFEIYEVVVR